MKLPDGPMPCPTVLTDSSDMAAILMNTPPKEGSEESKDGSIELGQNITWLGRSGIRTVQGVRIGFISGIDSDILGSECLS